jgi:hypothetical protein
MALLPCHDPTYAAARVSRPYLLRVILVVVSKASVASKWLRYELNVATDRMIKGECRVIPVVIDETPLPAELAKIGSNFCTLCRKGYYTPLHPGNNRASLVPETKVAFDPQDQSR